MISPDVLMRFQEILMTLLKVLMAEVPKIVIWDAISIDVRYSLTVLPFFLLRQSVTLKYSSSKFYDPPYFRPILVRSPVFR